MSLSMPNARTYDRRLPKSDSIKEEIGWLKALCGFLFAGDASILAWVAQNYAVANARIDFFGGCRSVVSSHRRGGFHPSHISLH